MEPKLKFTEKLQRAFFSLSFFSLQLLNCSSNLNFAGTSQLANSAFYNFAVYEMTCVCDGNATFGPFVLQNLENVKNQLATKKTLKGAFQFEIHKIS